MGKNPLDRVSTFLQEAVIGISLLLGLAIASVFATVVALLTFLFCTPVGWVILIILVAKHC